jgi:hypothetical protein
LKEHKTNCMLITSKTKSFFHPCLFPPVPCGKL